MRQALTLHPDFRCAPVEGIEAEAVRTPGGLTLHYSLTGDLDRLRLPPRAAPERTDELWRHTCFEAFIASDGGGYYEFNVSPSTQWAAYRFDGYREGLAPFELYAPSIAGEMGDGRLELRIVLDLADAALPENGTWRIGLSAVMETADGGLSYWALRHPPGKADFHHADCFALELPQNGQS